MIDKEKKSLWRNIDDLMSLEPEELIACSLGFDLSLYEQDLLAKLILHDDRIVNSKYIVSMEKCTNYDISLIEKSISNALSQCKLWPVLDNAKNILIKPNLIEARSPNQFVTTNPVFLAALLNLLHSNLTNKQITVAEASGHERDFTNLTYKTGISEVCLEHCTELIDLNYVDVVKVAIENPLTLSSIYLPKIVVDSDCVISLARMKTHHWTAVSLAMKNMFGCLPGSIYGFPKNRLHWRSIPRVIADVVSALNNSISIIDGIYAIEGDGPLMGELVPTGVISVGNNLFSVDSAVTRSMGFSPHLIPQFWFGLMKGLGTCSPQILDRGNQNQFTFSPPPKWEWLRDSLSFENERKVRIIKEQNKCIKKQ